MPEPFAARPREVPGSSILLLWLLLLMVQALALPARAQERDGNKTQAAAAQRSYELDYEARFMPAEGKVRMQLSLRQPRDLLREVRFSVDPARQLDFSGEGELELAGKYVYWRPPPGGGKLSYKVVVDHERPAGGFDSLMESNWAVLRGDDLVPPARVRALKGASSRARLRMTGPGNWSFISAYPKATPQSDWFIVDWPERNFDRPVGWFAAGRLGVRWGDIAGTRVAIAGPTGHGIRRMDIMAFLRWNLPTLAGIFPGFPKRILLVSAGDPMWRGGLSGPGSLFIHADRPLISGNGTSTLLHELMHIAQGYTAVKGQDWIIEAMAEYYTLEIMHRSGTLSGRRYARGHEKLEQWGEAAAELEAEHSSGARTAKGVAILQDVDDELRALTGGKASLDDVARRFSEDGVPVSVDRLRQVTSQLAGKPLKALADKNL
jgi:hypothetical protein